MLNFCYLNGKILPLNKAFLNLDDLGALRGYGVFEVLKTVNNKIFLYDEHFARLKNSAVYLGIKLPLKKPEIEEVIKKLILKNKTKQASIRIVLTGGRSKDAMTFNHNSPTFYILVSEYVPLDEKLYKDGVKLKTIPYARDFSEFKTTNYIKAVKIINERGKENFFEILYVSDEKILEAATSNFFVFIRDTLITPKNGILKGITRDLVLKIAKKDFKIEERDLKIKELTRVSEVFISATNKDILPVVKIDNKIIGNGKVGRNTKRIKGTLSEFMEKY